MQASNTLLLAPALAPLTGTSPTDTAIRDLARSLAKEGLEPTIVVGVDDQADTNRVGLARRLEAIEVGGTELVLFEGCIEGGELQVLALSQEGRCPEPSLLLRAAHKLGTSADLLQLWPETCPDAEALALYGDARVLLHLADPEGLPEGLAVDTLDMVVLPTRSLMRKVLRDKDSPLQAIADKLAHVVPGMDEREWNPSRDSVLLERMDPPSLELKARAKEALRRELGLSDEDLPMVGIVEPVKKLSRHVAEDLAKLPVHIAAVGAGSAIDSMASRSPGKVASAKALSAFEERQLRHRIIAAADFVLIPDADPSPQSRLYPCVYGASPIATKSGEAAERLVSFDLRSKTGSAVLYKDEGELVGAVERAIHIYEAGDEVRSALIERLLHLDLSWNTTSFRLGEHIRAM